MALDTITAGFQGATFQLQKANGQVVPGTLEFGTVFSGTAAFFRPAAPLDFGTTYTISVSPNIFDLQGNALASGLAARFTTVAATVAGDVTAPRVTLAATGAVNLGAVPRGMVILLVADATDDV